MGDSTINKSLAKPLVITASLLGIIQGLIWIICSVLSIFYYLNVIEINGNNDIYNLFLDIRNNNTMNKTWDTIVTPQIFFIFMWIYLGLSLIWLTISSYLIWVMIKEKWTKGKLSFGLWSLSAILISIIDIILMSLIAYDFDQFNSDSNHDKTDVGDTYGIVMSIAARGYTLLIINLIFAGVMVKFCWDLYRVQPEMSNPRQPIIYDHETLSSPWYGNDIDDLWMDDDDNFHKKYRNQAFTADDNDKTKSVFEQSTSFFPIISPADRPDSVEYSNMNYRTKTSTFDSKQSTSLNNNDNQQSIKHDPNEPYIPPPDYSPSGTPTMPRSRIIN